MMNGKIVMMRRVGTGRHVWSTGADMKDLERQLSEVCGFWNGYNPCSLWSMRNQPDFDYFDACLLPVHLEPTEDAIHERGKFIGHYVAVISTGICEAA